MGNTLKFICLTFFLILQTGCLSDDPLVTSEMLANLSNGQLTQISTPTEIDQNNLTLWLDATKIQKEDGALIDSWADLSGLENSATQMNSNKMPRMRKVGIDGQPSLQFDGMDDQLTISGTKLNLQKGFSGFLVFHSGTTNGIDPGIFGNGYDNHFQITHSRSAMLYFYVGSGTNHAKNSHGTYPAIVDFHWDGTMGTGSMKLYRFGELIAERASFMTPSVLADYQIGVAESHWPGLISEIILFKNVLSSEKQAAVRLYLQKKFHL